MEQDSAPGFSNILKHPRLLLVFFVEDTKLIEIKSRTNMLKHVCVSVWLSGRALRQQRKRLWVQFPGNTHTNEKMYNLNAV